MHSDPFVWLWDTWNGPARSGLGVAGSEAGAKKAAKGCIVAGEATTAQVERALFASGQYLLWDYYRTGEGWRTVRAGSGRIRWVPLTPASERAAS